MIARFISWFPFIKFDKKYVSVKRKLYKKYINNNYEHNDYCKSLIKINRDKLSLYGVPLNKIRFVFYEQFCYDIDNDIVNPKFETLLPVDEFGNIDENRSIIELGVPQNLIQIHVNKYGMPDNYQFIKEVLKKSKRGIVIHVNDDLSVDSDIFELSVLDDEVKNYLIKTYY